MIFDYIFFLDSLGLILILFLLNFTNLKIFLYKNSEETLFKINSNTRFENFDFIRGMSIFAIVIIHIVTYLSYFDVEWRYLVIFSIIYNNLKYAVASFILISGIFTIYKGFQSFWESKWKKLILPFLIISTIGYCIKFEFSDFDFLQLLDSIVFGKVFAPYYFFLVILETYAFYILILRKLNPKNKSIFIIIFLLINFLTTHFIYNFLDSKYRIYFNLIFTKFIFFFTFGYFNRDYFKDFTKLNLILNKKTIIWLFFTLFIYSIFSNYFSYKYYTNFPNHLLFFPFAIFLLLFKLSLMIHNTKIFEIIRFVGKNSLSIYLIHPILMHFLHAFDPFNITNSLVLLLYLVVIFLLNIYIPIFLWNKVTQILNKFITKSISQNL